MYGVKTYDRLQVSPGEVTINQRYVWLESSGNLELAGGLFKALNRIDSSNDTVPTRKSAKLLQWEEENGMLASEWYAMYGDRYSNDAARGTTRRALPTPSSASSSQHVPPRQYTTDQAPPERDYTPQVRRTQARSAEVGYPPSSSGARDRAQAGGGRGPVLGYNDRIDQPAMPERRREQGVRTGTGAGSSTPVSPSRSPVRAEDVAQSRGNSNNGAPSQRPASAPAPTAARPAFDQFLVKDQREKLYDNTQEIPSRRYALDAIDPRDAR